MGDITVGEHRPLMPQNLTMPLQNTQWDPCSVFSRYYSFVLLTLRNWSTAPLSHDQDQEVCDQFEFHFQYQQAC